MQCGSKTDLTIANTVTDLIQADVQEHLRVSRIPLEGDVLGLGTTTSLDNGELTFLPIPDGDSTTIWKCEAFNAGIRAVHSGDDSSYFPYVCFIKDATSLALQARIAEAIRLGRQSVELEDAAS